MIRYLSQMLSRRRIAEDEKETVDIPEEPAKEEEDPTAELEDIAEDSIDKEEEEAEEEASEKAAPEDMKKDSMKFKLWAEAEAKKIGYTIDVIPSSSGKTIKVIIDDSTDIITQRDAVKLAVLLDDNTMDWNLMEEPIVKGGGSWMIKFSKSEK